MPLYQQVQCRAWSIEGAARHCEEMALPFQVPQGTISNLVLRVSQALCTAAFTMATALGDCVLDMLCLQTGSTQLTHNGHSNAVAPSVCQLPAGQSW